ncbi:MAG TPA: signal peptide peptidase SppA [Candidatus Acidoferrales bacterium]|nr:signal peptide peptidase SppA [Candidatus Acidoferrales bacterium]
MSWAKRRAVIISILVVVFILIAWAAIRPSHVTLAKSVLVIDAQGEITEQRSLDILSALGGSNTPVLHDYLDAIDAARTDPRITGIVVRIGPLSTGWAKLEEIRSHLIAFQSSGKPSICYLGYDGIENSEYYLASACKQVWLVPSAPVNIHGMMAEATFYRGALDKLKIVPEYYHIAEYKTAGNEYTEKKFTPAHREEVESLLHSIYNQYVAETSAARHMQPAQFDALVKSGPFLSSEAVTNGLVDRLAYWDQVQGYFRNRPGGWNELPLKRYRTVLPGPSGDRIAVVHVTGLIASGGSGSSPTEGEVSGGDSIAAELRAARNDSGIHAIVLRVDSGGGSVVASEVIRREVQLANSVKPVVVSMSDTAASGGYWISAPASRIVADPDTITGSIGVLIGKFNLAGLYNMLGVSTDSVATSDNATLFSDEENFSPVQREYIQRSLQDTYTEFTEGVAAGRRMSVEAVDKIAKGRVWSGAQAKEVGLVDDLGGIDRAVEVAKQLAHIPKAQPVQLVQYPPEKTFWQLLLEHDWDESSRAMSLKQELEKIVSVMEPVQARVPFDLRIR